MGKARRYGIVFLIAVWLCLALVQSQDVDSEDVDFYYAFGAEFQFDFLKNIGKDIEAAIKTKNVNALIGYAGLFFYAEKLSGKTLMILTGRQILEEATRLAIDRHRESELRYLARAWEEEQFGPGDSKRAEELRALVDRKLYQLKMTPTFKKVSPGETIVFNVYTDLEANIPSEKILLQARYGTMTGYHYQAPSLPHRDVVKNITHEKILKDVVTAVYLPDGKVAYSVVIIEKKMPNKVWPSLLQQQWQKKMAGKILSSRPAKIRNEPRIDPIQYFSDRPQVLPDILRKSEQVRVKAIDKLVTEIKEYVSIFGLVDVNLRLGQKSFWAGIKTDEPYIYKSDPWKLRITASASADWVIESIKRNLEQQDLRMEEQLLESFKKSLPGQLEVEESVSLKSDGSS